MFVKILNGQVAKYPYTMSDLRVDHPNVSFPKILDDEELKRLNVYKVQPSQDQLFNSQVNSYSDSIDFIDGAWTQVWIESQLPLEIAAKNIRQERDRLLANTDWRFRSDMNPSQDWIDYCQALRDVPAQAGFPWDVTWPTQPE